MNTRHEIASLAEMQKFAETLAQAAKAVPRTLLLLDGPMGAGKTAFTSFFVSALGSSEASSPSFAIHNSYLTSAGSGVDHFDLFRLESADDLESTGFWDLFRARAGIVVIEWAERLEEFGLRSQLPRTWPQTHLTFSIVDSESRLIEAAQI